MRYLIGLMVALGLLFVLVFLLFHGSGKPAVPKSNRALQSYAATNAQAQLTIDGPINANQNHQAVIITVNSNNVTFEQIQGYQGNIVNEQNFASNGSAYTNFLFALAHAGFTQGNPSSSVSNEQGYCPLGDRYVFEFMQNGTDLERYWSTSCGGGTYKGNLSLTLELFQAQVPGYNALAQSIRL